MFAGSAEPSQPGAMTEPVIGKPYTVCQYGGCPYVGQRHGPLPVQEPVDYVNGEPPHPIFVERQE